MAAPFQFVRHQRISARAMRAFQGTNPDSRAYNDLTKCTQAWDSDDSANSEELDMNEAWGGHCRLCSVHAEEPHLLLYVLHGKLVDPRVLTIPELTPSVWSSLPQEVLERILALLPATSRCRFRLVSKGFNTLLSSASFKRLLAEVNRQEEPLICALEYRPGRLARCKPRSSEISRFCEFTGLQPLRLDLSFLPLEFQRFAASDCVVEDGLVCILKPQRRHSSRGMFGISSDSDSEDDDGLEDLTSEVEGMDFCVLNPMTRTWKVLPSEFGPNDEYEEERGKSWTVKLEAERNGSGHFRVLVVSLRPRKGGSSTPKLAATVYSSRSGSWRTAYLKMVQNLLPVPNECSKWPQYVLIDDLLYSAEEDDMQVHTLDGGKLVNCLDWDDDDFVEELVNAHADLGVEHKILGHCGRLFSVAQTDSGAFGIWKLNCDKLLWHKLSFLPEQLQKQLLEPPQDLPPRTLTTSRNNVKLFFDMASLVGDCICLSLGAGLEQPPEGSIWWKSLVAYHIPEDSWSLICHGLIPRRRSNAHHILQPTFFRL